MNRDLGMWTSEDSALMLVDQQPKLLEAIRSETRADVVELHARLLAKTARPSTCQSCCRAWASKAVLSARRRFDSRDDRGTKVVLHPHGTSRAGPPAVRDLDELCARVGHRRVRSDTFGAVRCVVTRANRH
jgi:hypothetical protein